MGRKIGVVQKFIRNTETWTELTASQWNSSGIFSQDSTRCSSVKKFKSLLLRLNETPEISQEEFYLCRCSTTSPVEQKTMKKNVWQMLHSFLYMQRDFWDRTMVISWSSEKKWYCIIEDSPPGVWDNIAERMLVEFAES